MMKPTISIMLLAVFLYALQSCAPTLCNKVSVNLTGVNSRIAGESDSWTYAFGLQGGLSYTVLDNFSQPISAIVEANVSMQGAGYEDDWGFGLVEGLTRLTYVNFPLVMRYQLENGFFGEAGLQPGFLVSARDKFDGESFDYKDWVNTFDFSIPLGVGYKFKNNVGVGVRVIPGITNINAGEGDISRDRNFVTALRGTYSFGKK